jgi:hypothetical protein
MPHKYQVENQIKMNIKKEPELWKIGDHQKMNISVSTLMNNINLASKHSENDLEMTSNLDQLPQIKSPKTTNE